MHQLVPGRLLMDRSLAFSEMRPLEKHHKPEAVGPHLWPEVFGASLSASPLTGCNSIPRPQLKP